MRTFIALPIPGEIKNIMADTEDELKSCHLDCRWVKPEKMHLTLKFLGEVDEAQVEPIKKVITRAANAFSSMIVNLQGYGFFPSQYNPRVFYISTDHESMLMNIADFLENELKKLGFKKEHRFRSHITLARLRSSRNIDCIERKMRIHPPQGCFSLNEIILFQSRLSGKGAAYQPLFKASFRP